MVKKWVCFFVALAATVGILFLVHANVDSYHGPTTEQTEDGGGH